MKRINVLALLFSLCMIVACVLAFADGQQDAKWIRRADAESHFRQVAGGFIPDPLSFIVPLSDWKVSVTTDNGEPWLTPSPSAGTNPGLVNLALVDWRAEIKPVGVYTALIEITEGFIHVTFTITWTVIPAAPGPATKYLPGYPIGCSGPELALCVDPNQSGFTPPTMGGSYIDAVFGSKVTVVSPPQFVHGYSSPTPISARGKYLYLFGPSAAQISLAADGSKVQDAPWDFNTWWSHDTDGRYRKIVGPKILEHAILTNTDLTVADFTGRFTFIKRGGTGDSSKDGWIPFWAPEQKVVCAMEAAGKTYCADYSKAPGLEIPVVDFVLISKGTDAETGKRYVMVVGAPSAIVYSVDKKVGALAFEYRGSEQPEAGGNHNGTCDPGERCFFGSHLDTFEDARGFQYVAQADYTEHPCEYALTTNRISKSRDWFSQEEVGGGRKRVMALQRCGGPSYVDYHLTCAKQAAACVISEQSLQRASTDTSPWVDLAHGSELLVMVGNGDAIRRVARTRTWIFTDSDDARYWSSPRAGISNDGKLLVSDGNFGQVGSTRVLLIPSGL